MSASGKLVFTKVHSDNLVVLDRQPGELVPLKTSLWITHADANSSKTCTAHCFCLEPGGTAKVEIQLATLRQELLHGCVFVHTDVRL